jgi:RNA polymerase sigma-70 factor (ECF subfamily)
MEGATDGTIVSGQSGAGATAQATATDADLIAESLSEAGRFATIYDRHAGTLFRFLVRRVGRDTADELLGETFRIAFERRATFDVERSSARPWLYGIATNLVAKHRRSEMRRLRATARLAGESGSFPEAAEAVAASVDAENAWSGVVAAIAALPDGERDAILLFVWEELSYEEIGAALGVPVGTVRSRLNRARRRLRELVPTEGKEAVNQPRNQSFSQRTRMGS